MAFNHYTTKKGNHLLVRSKDIPLIKKAEKEDIPIGIVTNVYNEWRVKISMFRFKFTLRGVAINFCVKYNIPLKNEYLHQTAMVWGID